MIHVNEKKNRLYRYKYTNNLGWALIQTDWSSYCLKQNTNMNQVSTQDTLDGDSILQCLGISPPESTQESCESSEMNINLSNVCSPVLLCSTISGENINLSEKAQ
jgi:hypothetical protein